MKTKYLIKQKRYHTLLVVMVIALFFSCQKFVVVDAPLGAVNNTMVFEDEGATLSAVLGVYQQMRSSSLSLFDGGGTLYPAMSADELLTSSTNADLLSFQNNSVIADNGMGIYSRLWLPAYKTIYYANAVIAGLENSKALGQQIKDQYAGEMLVVRSICYFYLTNLFGKVPLQLTNDYKVNALMAQSEVEFIYKQLIKDLKEAKELLPEAYPSANKNRPNKWTTSALLARVYLYNQEWKNAATEAMEVITSNKYVLETDLNQVFAIASKETLWQLPSDVKNTAEGATFIPATATTKPAYFFTQHLTDQFSNVDQRKSAWTKSVMMDGVLAYYPYKYKQRVATPVTENYVVLRLAELYLIAAESFTQLDDPQSGLIYLNKIRKRAGVAEHVSSTREQQLKLILQERQKELFCEYGHRWFDLKRTGYADEVLSVLKAPNWQTTDQFYPIPFVELQRNPSLKQNIGY